MNYNLTASASGTETPWSQTLVTDLTVVGEGRGTILSLKLDRFSDSVSGRGGAQGGSDYYMEPHSPPDAYRASTLKLSGEDSTYVVAVIVGFHSNVILNNALIDAYRKCGEPNTSFSIFSSMLEKDVVYWTLMIVAYTRASRIHAACMVFDEMPIKNTVSWTALIMGFAKNGRCYVALEVFRGMIGEGVMPSVQTFVSVSDANHLHLLICLSSQQLKLVMDSIMWAFGHAERNIPETGLNLLLETLKKFQGSEFCNQFYQTYFLTTENEIFAVLTDTFHKPAIKLHVLVLQHLFCLVETGLLTEPLWDVTTNSYSYSNNAVFVHENTIKLLSASFFKVQQLLQCGLGVILEP